MLRTITLTLGSAIIAFIATLLIVLTPAQLSCLVHAQVAACVSVP